MKRALVLASARLLATSACADGPNGNGTPREGGILTFAVGSDAGCVDPQQVGSNDTIYSLRQIVDSLTDQDPETGKIVPWLAEKWEVNADATTFTFHLRSGATFSDGSPQDPTVSLNPVKRVGEQVAEVLRLHGLASRRPRRHRPTADPRRARTAHPRTRHRDPCW